MINTAIASVWLIPWSIGILECPKSNSYECHTLDDINQNLKISWVDNSKKQTPIPQTTGQEVIRELQKKRAILKMTYKGVDIRGSVSLVETAAYGYNRIELVGQIDSLSEKTDELNPAITDTSKARVYISHIKDIAPMMIEGSPLLIKSEGEPLTPKDKVWIPFLYVDTPEKK